MSKIHAKIVPYFELLYFNIHRFYRKINKRISQLLIIQELNVLSRGCLTERQRSIALIYKALRYKILTGRMDNKQTADRLEKEEEEMIYLISRTNGIFNYLSFNNLTFRLAAV